MALKVRSWNGACTLAAAVVVVGQTSRHYSNLPSLGRCPCVISTELRQACNNPNLPFANLSKRRENYLNWAEGKVGEEEPKKVSSSLTSAWGRIP